MNIYSNILNRCFDYKGQAWQVIGLCEDRYGQTFRKVINMRTAEEMYMGYEEFWKVTPRGYSHNGIVEGA
jgi:hypothetical protein